MQYKYDIEGIKFSVSVTLKKSGVSFPNHSTDTKHNAWNVKIKYEGKSVTIPFYTSDKDYREGVKNYSSKDVLIWIHYILQDAHVVLEYSTSEEFKNDFGYEDLKTAKKVYKACENLMKKLSTIFSAQEIETLYEKTPS